MGLTHVTVSLSNLLTDTPAYENEFLVDTVAIDCLVPSKALFAAGVAVEGKAVYELANGEIVEYPYGFARVSFMGSETVTQVIFGSDDCEPKLGVVALENTGIGIDPITRTLKKNERQTA